MEEEPDADRPNGVTRRLVFLQNQNFIQTEVKMIEKNTKNNKSISKAKKGKDKKGKDSKDSKDRNAGESSMEFDYSYLDDHHRAVLTCLSLVPHIITSGSKVN